MNETEAHLPDGATRVYAIVGNPVVQVRSPTSMTREFRRRGVNAVLVPLQIAPADFDTALAALKRIGNFDGLILTLPHKAAALRHVDIVDDDIRLLGAINVLRCEADGRWRGDNFDGRGFVASLIADGYDPRGRSALVIGSGGAGSAVSFALAAAGVRELRVADLDPRRAEDLAQRLASRRGGELRVAIGSPDALDVDLLVNATTCGMDGDLSMPVDPARIADGTLVAEVVNKPHYTPLLEAARARGLSVQSGVRMSQGQTQLLVEFFLQKRGA